MGYLEKNLMPGEEVLLRPAYHWVRFAPGLAGLAAGAVIAIAGTALGDFVASPWIGAVAAAAGLAALVRRWASDLFDEFAVTSLRVVRKTGLVTRDVRQVPLEKVQDLNIRANLWGRWLAYGDVVVQTAGQDGTVVFPRIAHPEQFRNVLFAHLPRAGGAAAPSAAPAASPAPPIRSVEDRLKDLDRLRQQGLVTEGEYAAKRATLLAEL